MTEENAENKKEPVYNVEEEIYYNNPLGFTRETAALLEGLGCTNLTKFREREINLDDLKFLTEEDLRVLGVTEEFDFKSYQKLVFNLRKKYREPIPDVDDVLKILKSGNRQLKVIEIYLKYLNQKLSTPDNIQDFFMDKNRHLKASDVLLKEVNNFTLELKELQTMCDFMQIRKDVKRKNNFLKYSFIIGGASVILIFMYKKYARIFF